MRPGHCGPLRASLNGCIFLVSNVSDISSDPGLAALNGTSFYVSDINFLSNEALAWRGLATFVRIVDRYIGE